MLVCYLREDINWICLLAAIDNKWIVHFRSVIIICHNYDWTFFGRIAMVEILLNKTHPRSQRTFLFEDATHKRVSRQVIAGAFAFYFLWSFVSPCCSHYGIRFVVYWNPIDFKDQSPLSLSLSLAISKVLQQQWNTFKGLLLMK